MTRWIVLGCALLAAPVAQAHPHVFVEVGLRFVSQPDGRLSGVEVTWRYDDFFSLLVLEDRGLDPDGDMVLTGYWGRTPEGEPNLVRMTYSLGGDGSVRQYGQASTDHGLTWSDSFDLTYRPKAG